MGEFGVDEGSEWPQRTRSADTEITEDEDDLEQEVTETTEEGASQRRAGVCSLPLVDDGISNRPDVESGPTFRSAYHGARSSSADSDGFHRESHVAALDQGRLASCWRA